MGQRVHSISGYIFTDPRMRPWVLTPAQSSIPTNSANVQTRVPQALPLYYVGGRLQRQDALNRPVGQPRLRNVVLGCLVGFRSLGCGWLAMLKLIMGQFHRQQVHMHHRTAW